MRAAVADERQLTKEKITVLDKEIEEVQKELAKEKVIYQDKIKFSRGIQDKILHERIQVQGLMKVLQ